MPDNTNEQLIHFENMREIEEYVRNAEGTIGRLHANSELTQDADEARQLDVDRMDLEEEEDYIERHLADGHYIDGYEVAEIHKKYEKHISQLQKELEGEEDPAKVGKITDDINKLKESRNKELQRLCDEAPKYSRSAVRAMMAQQLRNNDAGRAGGEIKIYRKEEGHDGLLVTTYGKNRVGEINKMMRKHDERAAELAGRRAGEQRRNLGHAGKEFLQGDAEHMFKGSVSMGLHAALFLLNKLSQAGNKSAQWALYLYARNKLTMNDMDAIQEAVNDTFKKNIIRTNENDTRAWNGTIEPMDFNSPDLPPFEDMKKCETYDKEHDVMNVDVSYIDNEGTMRQGSLYLGSEENIRQFLGDIGLENEGMEAEIAENAAKVEALGIENLMVDNMQEAYENAAKEAEEEAEEATEVSEDEASEVVLEPVDEDIRTAILGEKPNEEVAEAEEEAEEATEVSKEEAAPDDLIAFMNENKDDEKLVGPVKPRNKLQYYYKGLEGDSMSLG